MNQLGCTSRILMYYGFMSSGGRRARLFPTRFKRNLPHIQAEGRTYLITFCTRNRWILPEKVRRMVLQHCLHDHGKTMVLHAAVVMPDHVHLLLTPLLDPDGMTFSLSEITGAIKGASSHSINRMLARRGSVWQDESFDHLLRRQENIVEKAAYICLNPVRKGLCGSPNEYAWLWRIWVEGQK